MHKTSFWELLNNVGRIEIPLIQRDYVQGRENHRSKEIAKKFVNALAQACAGDDSLHPLCLDFIFGSNDRTIFVPFDGQQRLTTLWLLHIYAAARAGKFSEACSRLSRFNYAVREDTALFCKAFLNFIKSSEELSQRGEKSPVDLKGLAANSSINLKELVKEQPWFLPQWEKDPTICGILNVLNYIDKHFRSMPDIWDKLSDSDRAPIQFYFQDIKELKTSGDELLIKMNARGKQLTEYEVFKERFLEWLKESKNDKEASWARNLNTTWQDFFWRVFENSSGNKDKARFTDECFCNFLRWFATMLLYFDPNFDIKDNDEDLFATCKQALAADAPSPLTDGNNLLFLEKSLNSLLELEQSEDGLQGFFNGIFQDADEHIMPTPGKISWFHFNHVDMFEAVCVNQPTIADSQMLFAIFLILCKKGNVDDEGKLVLRVLRNLFANSTSEMYAANFPQQLKWLAEFTLAGNFNSDNAYNGFQLKEEKRKLELRRNSAPELCAQIDWLEDHPLLRGCLAMFTKIPNERANPDFEEQTLSLGQAFFSKACGADPVAWDTLLRGFLASGDFVLHESPNPFKFIYLGAEIDYGDLKKINIFTTTRKDSFPGIRKSVQALAQAALPRPCPVKIAINAVADEWITKREQENKFDWCWYFVKYAAMRPDYERTQGRYDWVYSPRSFEQRELLQKTIHGEHWNPFLWAVYVEAGFNAGNFKNIKWVSSEETEGLSQIIFNIQGSELAIWPYEFFWLIGSPSGNRLGTRQSANLNELRTRLARENITLDDEGRCFIPGENAHVR